MTCRVQTLLRPIGSHWGVRVWAPRTHRILRAAFDTLLHSSRSCCKDTPGSFWDQCICIHAATVLQLALAPELLQLLPCLRLHSARWIALQAMSLLTAPSCLQLRASHRWMCWRVSDSWMSLCLLPVFPRFVQLVIERSWLVFQLFGRWFTVAWPSAPHGLVAVDELLSDRVGLPHPDGLPVSPHGSMGALDTQLVSKPKKSTRALGSLGPFRSIE